MFSLENLIALLGDPAFGDRLEKIAYNALPGDVLARTCGRTSTTSRPTRSSAPSPSAQWTNNGDDSNLFGLEPNFGCCTANMHQGWPKFVANLWMATQDDGLAAVAYGPAR